MLNSVKPVFFLLLISLSPIVIKAQDVEKMNAIAAKYSKENAVVINNTEEVTMSYEKGELRAKSNITRERLLISDHAPQFYNTENVFFWSFAKLESIEAEALFPEKKGYRSVKVKDYLTVPARTGSFFDDVKVSHISFPGLLPNAITRVNYTLEYTDLHHLPKFYFQDERDDLVTVRSVLKVKVPKSVKIKFVLKGMNTKNIKQSSEENGKYITYLFIANNVPKPKAFDNAPNNTYYLPHVVMFIESYQLPGDDNPTTFLADPAGLYSYFYKFIKNVNKKDEEVITKTVEEVTKGDASPRQKAKHIYQWVQKNMHYVAFEDSLNGFIPRQAVDICNRKFGDCKDMASILVAMCRKAGLEAYFTWIGTRILPYTYEETPIPGVDNHMICAIKLDNEWVFLDGTDPMIPFGFPPYAIQGKEALIGIDKSNFKIVTVPEMDASKNVITDSTIAHIDDKDLVGKTNISYKGYGAWEMRIIMMYQNDNEKEKKVKAITSRGSNGYVQSSYDYKIPDVEDKTVIINSAFTIKGYVQNAGKEYYVNMNLLRKYETERIDTAERVAPIEEDYKYRKKEVVVLDIPAGYHVSYLPPAKEEKVNGLWSYSISYKTTPKQVILTKEYEMNTLYVKQEQFAAHNKMIDDLKNQYKESVVLTANK